MNNTINNPGIKILLSGILTVHDMRMYLEYVRQLEMILYNANINFSEESAKILPHDLKEKLLSILHVSKIDPSDSPSMQIFLAELRAKIKELPIMGLTIAYDPSEKDLRDFSSFLYTNLGYQIVFHIQKDPLIIGGCKMEFNGKIMDYSLVSMIRNHKVQSKNPEEIHGTI